MKHTQKTLAKYIGLKGRIIGDEHTCILEGFESNLIALRCSGRYKHHPQYPDCVKVGRVLPVLKKSKKGMNFNIETLTYKEGLELLEKGFGAMPDKSSPTGYISIHDGIMCYLHD